jgi:hypothetical protein
MAAFSTAEALSTTTTAFDANSKSVLYDPFDRKRENWEPLESDGQAFVETTPTEIEDGLYTWSVKSEGQLTVWSLANVGPLSDFQLTVEVVPEWPGNGSSNGVVFRYNDPRNYYYFGLDSEEPEYQFVRVVDGAGSTLIPWTDYSHLTGGALASRFRVIAQGSHFVFVIDGHHANESDDAWLAEGRVGLGMDLASRVGPADYPYQGEYRIDSFDLRAPSLPAPSP